MKKHLLYFLASATLAACSSNPKEAIDYVDPFIGTGFHGHTYPGATTPFGAVQLSPDTRIGNWDACSGYHYTDSTIIGFSHTHLSGTGCIDLGDILFHPTTKEINHRAEGRYIFDPYPFSHKDEKASPGYYSVDLKTEGIKAELTATKYVGVHRYAFDGGLDAKIVIDMTHLLTDETIDSLSLKQTAPNEIAGMRRSQGWVTNQYVYFVAQFSKDFRSTDFLDDNKQVVIHFGKSDSSPIVAKVGLSAVSEENARLNLENEVKDFDFDAIRLLARTRWAERLNAITVESPTEDNLKNFYTAMYHSMIMPNIMSDTNGQYRRHDMKTGQVPNGKNYYSAFSIWDTFRAWNPLMTLINTDLVNDMVYSYKEMYDASGELPIWPLSAGETGTMIGYHSVSVIADAYIKDILKDNDMKTIYEAVKVSSDKNKKGSDYYLKYGFIPSNIKKESVSCVLEYAYDDWCIAQIAAKLGYAEDSERYKKRALSYINVFDGYTKFFRGKRMDGNWEYPFNPYAPGRDYTEATAWQYRFFVPHDVNGLVQLFGGREAFITALDSLFVAESKVDGDMADITGMIGQYGQGNEPSHHMAYLYNYVGQPWKTQYWTRRILDELYKPTPEGISGNEDCGQMSAWYILSSLGFYQVCPGTDQFIVTTPLFDKAIIKLANGKTLTITANDPLKNTYIDKVTLNGVDIPENYLNYKQLMNGGNLEYHLTDNPNQQRATEAEYFLQSLTKGNFVSIPYTLNDLDLFIDNIDVILGSATENAKIYYTLNGKEPDESSFLYEKPIHITATTNIKAKAFKDGYQPSGTFNIVATKAVLEKAVAAGGTENGTNFTYYEGDFNRVSDMFKTQAKDKGIMPTPTIANAKQEDHFAYAFEGIILVPEDGVYEFMTRSDDGSVLYINNKPVVNNDGSHAAIMATGRVALHKGYHRYRLLYFEDYEGEHLSWGWKTPSSNGFVAIPTENLFVK